MPTEKVRMGIELCACASALTVAESTPPERNSPTGTSEATMRCRTALRSRWSNSSIASCSLPEKGAASPARTVASIDQYGCGRHSVARPREFAT